jgi:hypothetical protein
MNPSNPGLTWKGGRRQIAKCASAAVLLLTVLLWSNAEQYGRLVRFAVCAGAQRLASLAAAARRYVWETLFVGMALLYNPVFPVFPFSGRLYLILVAASVAPFGVPLAALRPRLERAVAMR